MTTFCAREGKGDGRAWDRISCFGAARQMEVQLNATRAVKYANCEALMEKDGCEDKLVSPTLCGTNKAIVLGSYPF